MGLSPTHCRKVMTPCIQSVAMFGSELWWTGDLARGTIGQANELQLLVNQEARTTTGCLRTTNLGSLSMESRFRPATAELENRQHKFGLQLLGLPQGYTTREVIRARKAIGRRLTNALAYSVRTEATALLEEPETPDTELLQEEETEAKALGRGREGPTGTHHVHRRVTARQWCGRVLVVVEEGPDLGGHQNLHGLQPED